MNVVVIATYNEADNIEELLQQLKDYKVVLVDDNSPDGTASIAKKFGNVDVLVREGKLGISSAYKTGFIEALKYNPEYIIQMDAGLTHDPKEIPYFLDTAIKFNSDLVLGDRFSSAVKKSIRTHLSLIAAALMRFIHIPVNDATCGFRCWKSSLLSKIVLSTWLSEGFAFQLETLYMAYKKSKNIHSHRIDYKLSNSTLSWKIILEAMWIYFIIFFS